MGKDGETVSELEVGTVLLEVPPFTTQRDTTPLGAIDIHISSSRQCSLDVSCFSNFVQQWDSSPIPQKALLPVSDRFKCCISDQTGAIGGYQYASPVWQQVLGST